MGRSSTGVVAWYWRIGSRCAGVPREKDNLAIYPRGAGRSHKTPEFPSGAAVYWAWMIIRPEVTPLQLEPGHLHVENVTPQQVLVKRRGL
jgi:hypothetical protein